jgi:tetratricopeptide (TPR) repeat protein
MSSKQNKIKIQNISNKIDKEEFRRLFKDCGEIKKIQFTKVDNRLNDVEIFFVESKSVNKAMDKNGIMLKENIINIEQPVKRQFTLDEYFEVPDKNNLTKVIKEQNMPEDAENYGDFMDEYKEYFKKSHKESRKLLEKSGEVPELLGKANNLYLDSKHDEAIALLHQVISISPNIQEPYLILSRIHEERDDIKNALSFLMLAAQLSRGESDIWVRCANLNKRLRNIQQAEFCITRALKIDRKNAYLMYERAALHEELGNFTKAASLYEKVLNLNLNHEIVFHISNLYEKQGLHDKALDIIKKNIDKLSRKLKVLIRFFSLILKSEKYADGLEMYQKLNSEEVTRSEIYLENTNIKLSYLFCNLALNYKEISESNMLEEILSNITEVFLKAESDIENYSDLLSILFDILNKRDKVENFIEIYENLARVSSAHFFLPPDVYSKIADIYFNSRKEYQKAIEFYKKALKETEKQNSGMGGTTNMDTVRIKFSLSEIYKLLGDYNSALEVLNSNYHISEHHEPYSVSQEKQRKLSDGFKKPFPVNSNLPESSNNIDVLMNDNYDLYNSHSNPFLEEERLNENFIRNQIFDEVNTSQMMKDQLENQEGIIEEDNSILLNNEDSNPFLTKRNKSLIEESNNILESVCNSRPLTKPKKRLLGKKKFRISSISYQVNHSIDNYNFENYLSRRSKVVEINTNSSNISSNPYNSNNTQLHMKNLNSLRMEYEELNEEFNLYKDHYIKLKESLIYIETGNEQQFLNNTFTPLKQVLIQELKLEGLRNQLFLNVLEKSHIKNFFKIKENIFSSRDRTQSELIFNYLIKHIEIHENETELINQRSSAELHGDDSEDEIVNTNIAEKDSIFVRKTHSKSVLIKKKVKKTFDFVSKQISNLQNIEKFLSQEDFMKIIVNFIRLSYKNSKHEESNSILKLLLSSNKFKCKTNILVFDMYIYTILNNYKLKNFKVAFYFMKILIAQYDLKDFKQFWVIFWEITKNLDPSYVRSFLYKTSLTKNLTENPFLNTILGSCYLQTNNFGISISYLKKVYPQPFNKDNPFFLFILALDRLYRSMSRKNQNKEFDLLQAHNLLQGYAAKRTLSSPLEVLFNLGRYYQFLGHDKEAYKKYDELLSKICFNRSMDSKERELLQKSTLYNYALMQKKSGNEDKANEIIMENFII